MQSDWGDESRRDSDWLGTSVEKLLRFSLSFLQVSSSDGIMLQTLTGQVELCEGDRLFDPSRKVCFDPAEDGRNGGKDFGSNLALPRMVFHECGADGRRLSCNQGTSKRGWEAGPGECVPYVYFYTTSSLPETNVEILQIHAPRCTRRNSHEHRKGQRRHVCEFFHGGRPVIEGIKHNDPGIGLFL